MQLVPTLFSAAQRAAETVTDEWMAEYRGLIIGAPDSPLSLVAVDGLLDVPGMRTSDRAALSRHGDVSGSDYLGSRTVTLTIEAYGRDGAELADALNAVTAAFTPAAPDAPLVFRFPGIAGGGVRFVSARVRKRGIPVNVEYSNGLAMVTVEMYCASPLIVSPVLLRDSAPLADANALGGGIKPPFRFPIKFGPPRSLGIVRVLNEGNFTTYPKFIIRGPVTNPQIINLATGQMLSFNYTLLRGEWLDIDTYTHEVLLNGTAPRFLTSGTANTWLTCSPGLTEFVFRGFRIDPGSGGEGASLECQWTSAWV
ncbi:phage distal tail protein [Amycolatopsis sp. lyj-108]|uniref:phage distal tail protein n=1 Tax=Amycolatopsis sp. lyj-108 TaxID=2789286 RepID=UPI00397D10FB